MDGNQSNQLPLKTTANQDSEFNEDCNRPFEVLLTQEQFKQLQKLLPVGYSLGVSNKNTRLAYKKPAIKEANREEDYQNNSNIQRQKRKAYREAEQIIKGTGDFVKKCKVILDLLKKHPSSDPFTRPVDPIALRIPDYLEIIKEPMDLGTVHKKLLDDQYAVQSEFETDVRKVWSNAFTYNLPNTQIYKMTEEMSNYFEKLLTEENPKMENVTHLKQQVSKISKRVSDYEGGHSSRYKSSNTSQKALSDKPLSYAEKKNLSQMIRQLPSDCLWDVWKIVAPDNQNQGNEELEFDIDKLPLKTSRELEAFVRTKIAQLNRKKNPQRKIGSTNEFNAIGSHANLGNAGAGFGANGLKEGHFSQNPGNGSIGGNAIASFEQLPVDVNSKNQGVEQKKGEDDDESSFISSLDDSDY